MLLSFACFVSGCTGKDPSPVDTAPAETGLDETGLDETGLDETSDDSTSSAETGLVQLHYLGRVVTEAGAFVEGDGGGAWTGSMGERCRVEAVWTLAATALVPCAECDWAFPLTANGGTAAGEDCLALGVSADLLDGWNAGWGYAADSVDELGGPVRSAIFLYYPAPYSSWELLGWEGDGRSALSTEGSEVRFEVASGLYYYLPGR